MLLATCIHCVQVCVGGRVGGCIGVGCLDISCLCVFDCVVCVCVCVRALAHECVCARESVYVRVYDWE